ncbi:MAG: helix-turn-helix transcriptional regulator [Alphaproteobacteria bacterium]
MSELDDMTAAVDAIYAASVGQTGWHEALDAILRATDHTHASVYASNRLVRQAATETYRLPVTGYWHNHDPAIQQAYETEFFRDDPNRHYRLRHPRARIMSEPMYGDDRTLDRNAFYAWAEKVADLRYFLYGQTDPDAQIGAVVSLHRSRRQGPATADEIARYRPLLAHIQRAAEIEHHMAGALALGFGSLDLLEANPTGIVLLDGLGLVIVANRAARDIAATGDALTLDDTVTALRRPDDARLQRLIGDALEISAGSWREAGGSLRLARRSGRRGYVVTVAPVSRRESILSNLMPAASLLITDPEADAAPAATAVLRDAYGLTAMESRLVERLMAGDSPTEAAVALGIQATTARTHLSAVFRKTETGRQQDLVRLVATLPWWAK